jgi:hypothetical protein
MSYAKTLKSLAAVLLAGAALVGCGGGDAEPPPPPVGGPPAGPDTTAPTVAIANNVAAPTATGPVTFSFVFSEDVGVSFEAADVVVTGGTAATFTRVGGSQATLVVTPTANTSGTMSVSVAASKFSDIAGNANTAGATASKDFDVRLPTGPTTAAPTPPVRAAGDVLSVFSDAYTPIAGINLNPDWGQSTVATTVTVAGNATRKYATLNYQGIDWSANPINVSTMTKLHIDVWTPDVTSVLVSIISAGAENAVTLTPTIAGWNSFDIDMALYTVPIKSAIIQIKIEGTPAGGTLYFDNLYFWKPAAGGGGTSTALITFDETPAPKLTDFGVNGAPPVIATDPAGGTNKVLKVFKYALPAPGSEQWAGVTVSTGANDSIPAIPFTASAKTMTVRAYSPAVGVRVRLKVENATNNGISVETDAITTTSGAWETLTFNFANPGTSPPVGGGATSPLDLTKTYNKISIFSDFGIGSGGSAPLPADRVYYYDDISFVGAPAGGGGGGACGTTAPTCAPTTTIPAGSTIIYSDAASVAGLDTAPVWGQSPPVTASEVTIAGNKSMKYVFGALYQGIDWSASPQNVSTKSTLHLDFFSPDITSMKVSIISTGKESAVTKAVTPGSWNAIDIDLALYTVQDKTAIIQIKLEPNATGTLYVDNIYFYGSAGGGGASCGTTAPTCAPTTTIPAGSTIIYSDAASVAGLDTAPVWGQAPPVTASEVTIAGNKSMKYVFGALYQGIDWSSSPQDVSTKGTLHLDVWTADVATIKVSLIGGGSENGITKTLTAGTWNSLDIDMSLYTSPNKAAIIQMKLEPNVAGTIYVDNIHFYGTAAGGGGGGGTFTGGIFSSDYSGNLGAATAKSDKNGTVGFFVDPRLFAVKIFEDGSVCGSACNPGGVYNFYYGIGKPATPTYADAYFGGFVNAPGNTTADASAFAKIQLKFWGDAESWEKPNFTAQVNVIVQGPTNAACTNPSGRPELSKAVTAQKIGAGSDYIIPKTDFVLAASCGGAYTVDSVWAAVGSVVVLLSGSSNLNYVNLTPSTPPSYPTFLNIGPIKFIN